MLVRAVRSRTSGHIEDCTTNLRCLDLLCGQLGEFAAVDCGKAVTYEGGKTGKTGVFGAPPKGESIKICFLLNPLFK